ncbi:MAG: phosphate ABC transporter permease PstA [Fimbriimonadales bacterium]
MISSSLSSRRKFKNALFARLCLLSAILATVILIALIWGILQQGLGRLNADFFSNFGSRMPSRAGIKAALLGTVWVVALTGVIAIPVGLAAAIYLEEFAKKRNRLASFIEVNIANLASVPSIIFGLLGLAVFVRWFALDRSIISGALTMSLLILPTVVLVSREALRAVPSTYRDASFAVGATKWQTVRRVVLPAGSSGIMTGIILALSRAIGETAPLITIGAVSYISFVPSRLGDKFTVLPLQVFEWSSRPQVGFHEAAAAAILVLIGVLLILNSIAITIRLKASKHVGGRAG